MRRLKYTYVDAVTGISVFEAVAKNGPSEPAVKGLQFGFAIESEYPTSTPTFYGTAPDGSAVNVAGVFEELTEVEYQAVLDTELKTRHAQSQLRLTATNNTAYESAISKMTCDYPPTEITTWERQRAEAVAWGANNSAPTPWINIAAAARGLERDEYLTRTLAKVNAFAVASAYLTGRRQGIDDQIRAATTPEELAAIVIDYSLPGA